MQAHELEKKLKRLRLGRMLDILDLRLEQAQQGKLGYLEFLDLLLEDEINRRANQALAQRVAPWPPNSGVYATHTLAGTASRMNASWNASGDMNSIAPCLRRWL